MNNEEVSYSSKGFGDLLPAEVLKEYKGSIVFNIYEKGSQHVDTQINISHPSPPKGREKEAETPALPEALSTEAAMALWKKAHDAGYVDDHFQPLISRTQAAILADEMSRKLEITEKWKTFEMLWNRRNMYRDYHDALNQRQTLIFRDKLKALFR